MSAESFIDTNVFVYHLDATDRRKQRIAEGIVRSALERGDACTSAQVVQECLKEPIASPYLICYQPKARKREQIEAKLHWSAVTDDYLTKEFRKARDLAKAYDHIENPKARPTMHELRALGSWLYEQQGFSTEYVQALLGHATPEMTAYYQDGHAQKEVIYQHVQAGLKL